MLRIRLFKNFSIWFWCSRRSLLAEIFCLKIWVVKKCCYSKNKMLPNLLEKYLAVGPVGFVRASIAIQNLPLNLGNIYIMLIHTTFFGENCWSTNYFIKYNRPSGWSKHIHFDFRAWKPHLHDSLLSVVYQGACDHCRPIRRTKNHFENYIFPKTRSNIQGFYLFVRYVAP